MSASRTTEAVSVSSMHQDKGGGHKGHIGTAKANQEGDEHCQPGTCEVCVGGGIYAHKCADACMQV